MSTFSEALDTLSTVLFNPKSQKPTVDQRFVRLSFEFQNMYNELENTGIPWTYNKKTISVTQGTQDYMVSGVTGKVLFAYAQSDDNLGPTSLEIADLASVSSDYYPFNLLDYGVWRDFNELWGAPYPAQIALYYDNGILKFRLSPYLQALSSVTLVYSSGNWIEDMTPDSLVILASHHMLPIVRAAKSLLAGTEWTDQRDFNLSQREQLGNSLRDDEARYALQFATAKKGLSLDSEVSYREPFGGDW
jgi:hypothetical protein